MGLVALAAAQEVPERDPCRTARSTADLSLAAAGVGALGWGVAAVSTATLDDELARERFTGAGTGLGVIGAAGTVGLGIATVPSAARCGRTGRGVTAIVGGLMLAAGPPLESLAAVLFHAGVTSDSAYGVIPFVLGIPVAVVGVGLTASGVIANRVARGGFAGGAAILPVAGGAPGVSLVVRW